MRLQATSLIVNTVQTKVAFSGRFHLLRGDLSGEDATRPATDPQLAEKVRDIVGLYPPSWIARRDMAERGSILIVGGYGEVGRRIAAHLAPDYPDRIIIAGRNALRASSLADRLGHGVRPIRLDIDDRAAIEAAIRGVTLVVTCVRQREPHLLHAAIEHGLSYTDIASFRIWREAVALRATARVRKARIVLGAGLVPGISSVMGRAAAERLGEVDVIHTSLLLAIGDAFGPDALDYLLTEITRSFVVVEDGHERSVRSFTDGRRVRFPAPIGSRVAYRAPFTDQLSYPETLGARTAACRLALDPPWVTALVAALVRSRVAYLTDRPVFRQAIRRFIVTLQSAYAGRDRYALVVEAGSRSGGSLRLSVTGHNQSEGTAIGATLIAAALDRGEVILPRFGGQLDYAANAATWALSSNSIGLM